MLVLGKRKPIREVTVLTIDFAVNGVGCMPRIFRENLRSAPCGSQQHRLASAAGERLHNAANHRGFTSTGIAIHQHHRLWVAVEHEMGKRRQQFHLLIVGFVRQTVDHFCGKLNAACVCGADTFRE